MVSLDQPCRPVMPIRLNPNRPKRFRARYRIRNWPQYEGGLKRRGDLIVWLDQAAIAEWHASRRITPGGQGRRCEDCAGREDGRRRALRELQNEKDGVEARPFRIAFLDFRRTGWMGDS